MSVSRILHHFPFDPASRAARLALGETRLAFVDSVVRPWEPDCPLQTLNPSGMPPVLEEIAPDDRLVLCGLTAILGRIDDLAPGPALLGREADERGEARRLLHWFERRFTDEVDAYLLHERMEKPLLRLGPPEARALREGREALRAHLQHLEALAAARAWLAGGSLSHADFAAAAHLSVLDYFGEVAWAGWPALKTWYMKIKSRPCFRPLLVDRLPGVAPAAHYTDLDF